MYKEIRIDSTLEGSDGGEVKLETGDHVNVTVQKSEDNVGIAGK